MIRRSGRNRDAERARFANQRRDPSPMSPPDGCGMPVSGCSGRSGRPSSGPESTPLSNGRQRAPVPQGECTRQPGSSQAPVLFRMPGPPRPPCSRKRGQSAVGDLPTRRDRALAIRRYGTAARTRGGVFGELHSKLALEELMELPNGEGRSIHAWRLRWYQNRTYAVIAGYAAAPSPVPPWQWRRHRCESSCCAVRLPTSSPPESRACPCRPRTALGLRAASGTPVLGLSGNRRSSRPASRSGRM